MSFTTYAESRRHRWSKTDNYEKVGQLEGTTFHLDKRHYFRPEDAFGDTFRYQLKDEVVEWLDVHNVEYFSYWNDVVSDSGKVALWFYIKITDPQKAMLFKLAWI